MSQSMYKRLNELGCYHNDNEIKPLDEFDHLSVMGYNKQLVCNVCKKRVGIK